MSELICRKPKKIEKVPDQIEFFDSLMNSNTNNKTETDNDQSLFI